MNNLIKKLKDELSEGRFIHSLGVAECAKELALRFGCSAEQAYLAGLLHDCATKYPPEEMLSLAISEGLCAPDATVTDPTAEFHARLGAIVAKNEYGIIDPEILNAIALHQIGGVPMSKLDIIVSLADAIEPSRTGERIEAIRKIAKTNLIAAYLDKCQFYMENILASSKTIPQERIDVFNYVTTLL